MTVSLSELTNVSRYHQQGRYIEEQHVTGPGRALMLGSKVKVKVTRLSSVQRAWILHFRKSTRLRTSLAVVRSWNSGGLRGGALVRAGVVLASPLWAMGGPESVEIFVGNVQICSF